jgi:hypothetical protein
MPKASAEPKSEAETNPESTTGPKPEINEEHKAETKGETPSDPRPELVKRVHKFYEELGREDVREVQDWEKAEQKSLKDEGHR